MLSECYGNVHVTPRGWHVCRLGFVNLTQTVVTWEEGMPSEDWPPVDRLVGVSVGRGVDSWLMCECPALFGSTPLDR